MCSSPMPFNLEDFVGIKIAFRLDLAKDDVTLFELTISRDRFKHAAVAAADNWPQRVAGGPVLSRLPFL